MYPSPFVVCSTSTEGSARLRIAQTVTSIWREVCINIKLVYHLGEPFMIERFYQKLVGSCLDTFDNLIRFGE